MTPHRSRPAESTMRAHREDNFVPPGRISDLLPGTRIRALQETAMIHYGPVTDILPDLGLVWIFDEQSRTRKIIDSHEFTILAQIPTTDPATAKDKP